LVTLLIFVQIPLQHAAESLPDLTYTLEDSFTFNSFSNVPLVYKHSAWSIPPFANTPAEKSYAGIGAAASTTAHGTRDPQWPIMASIEGGPFLCTDCGAFFPRSKDFE
jgi:hypothetical protein